MPTIELSDTTVRNLVRASQQEMEHIRHLADSEDCPDRASERLERNASSIEGSVEMAEKKLPENQDEADGEVSND